MNEELEITVILQNMLFRESHSQTLQGLLMSHNDIYVHIFAEHFGDGSSLLLPLVRRFGGSQNVRADRVSAVSKSYVNIGGEILYSIFRSLRFGKIKS